MDPSLTAWIAIAIAVSGAAATFLKSRAESRNLTINAATAVVATLRAEMDRLQTELDIQRDLRIQERERERRRIDELKQEQNRLNHRVQKLEMWIINNTSTDPATINGWPV